MAHPKSHELGASGGVSEISTNQTAALSGYGKGRGSAGSDSEMMGHRRFQSATMSAPTLTLSGRSAAPLPHTLILNSVSHFKHFITETSPPLATSCPVEGTLDRNEPWTLGRSGSVPSSLSSGLEMSAFCYTKINLCLRNLTAPGAALWHPPF